MDKERLALEITCELNHLRRLADTAQRMMAVPPTERHEWDAWAAAKCITDLWMGFENLCKRRYAALGCEMPTGPDSHRRILDEFMEEMSEGLSPIACGNLRKYLSFRHRFIHNYGDQLSWSIVEEPLRLLPETVALLARIWTDWLDRV